jgi:hypothetical protein
VFSHQKKGEFIIFCILSPKKTSENSHHFVPSFLMQPQQHNNQLKKSGKSSQVSRAAAVEVGC